MLPKTTTQEWLRKIGACLNGRRRTGKKSLRDAIRTCRPEDLHWLLRHVEYTDTSFLSYGSTISASQMGRDYISNHWRKRVPCAAGRWATKRMLDYAHQHGALVPLGV